MIHTILGAGGVVANSLVKELVQGNQKVRLAGRNPKAIPGTELIRADITNLSEARSAIAGSSVVYLCIGLKYDFRIWRDQWPKIMNNTIEACKESGARLLFFDNVYMYGRVNGPMTEETPYNPVSRKGDLRARLATQLMSEVRKENLTAMIARSADFYGPDADKTSVANILVFANLAKKKKPQWMANAGVKHSFTYSRDIGKSIALLANGNENWNQVWHLPTAPDPFTGEEFIHYAAEQSGTSASYSILKPWMIKLGGLYDRTIGELYEMLYQYQDEYLFDSSKFNHAFQFTPTGYKEGIRATVQEAENPKTKTQ